MNNRLYLNGIMRLRAHSNLRRVNKMFRIFSLNAFSPSRVINKKLLFRAQINEHKQIFERLLIPLIFYLISYCEISVNNINFSASAKIKVS